MREDIDLLVRLHYSSPCVVGELGEGEWEGGWIATAEVLGHGPDLAKHQAVDDSAWFAALVAVRERVHLEENHEA